MKKGILFLSALILSIFLITSVSALGTWEQIQKDEKLTAYSSLTGYFFITPNETTISANVMTQPLVNDFNNLRKIVIFNDINGTYYIEIYDSGFNLESSVQINNSVYSATTHDWDNDGNTEIIFIMNETKASSSVGTFRFMVYEYIATSQSFTEERNIPINYSAYYQPRGTEAGYYSEAYIGNIACGEFVGSNDCIFINGLNISSPSGFIFAFNTTSSSYLDNPFLNFDNNYFDIEEFADDVFVEYAGKMFFSLEDLDGDGNNEINFAVAGYPCDATTCYHGGGNLDTATSLSTFISLNKSLDTIRNFRIYNKGNMTMTDYYFHYEGIGGEEAGTGGTTTKIAELGTVIGDSVSKEIIIGINFARNGKTVWEHQGGEASSVAIYNNSGFKKWSKDFHIVAGGTSASQVDFVIYGTKVYAFGNYGSGFRIIIIDYLAGNSYSRYNTSLTGWFGNFIQLADFDNDNEVEVLTQHGIFKVDISAGSSATDFWSLRYVNLTSNDLRLQIPADIDKDYSLEIIDSNSTNLIFLSPDYINQAPRITVLYWTPEFNPVCINNNIGYWVDYADDENDLIYMRTDCYGNGSYTYSNLSANPIALCNMSELGNYNAEICIRDAYHSTWASCVNHEVTTAITNCYFYGEGIGNSTVSVAGESNVFGFYREQFATQPKGYTSEIFDWGRCEGWTMLYGLCPVWIWIQGLGTVIWNFIFATFWLFLILILVIVILAFLKKKYLNQ